VYPVLQPPRYYLPSGPGSSQPVISSSSQSSSLWPRLLGQGSDAAALSRIISEMRGKSGEIFPLTALLATLTGKQGEGGVTN